VVGTAPHGPGDLFGASDLLVALGWRSSFPALLRFSGTIVALTFGIAAVTVAVGEAIGLSPVALQLMLWAGWLVWLGYLLPRHQKRDLLRGRKDTYKKAFWRELGFGIGFNFAMLLRPAATGLVETGADISPWLPTAGLLLIALGSFCIFDGARQLGISCAFFVYEYSGAPRVVKSGLYRLVRHPLFTGGICVSIGMALCVGTAPALKLALVNALILLVYRPVEDQRCSRTMGGSYLHYRAEVNGILPFWGRSGAGEAARGKSRNS
jgi:protein-S-isoprenylcysteine O-methyltransferase Ste14